MKCSNGQTHRAGDSFAVVDPQEWKQHMEEKEEEGCRSLQIKAA
jgi:hypothetical protein